MTFSRNSSRFRRLGERLAGWASRNAFTEVQGCWGRLEFVVFLALGAITLWLFNRPYTGIWHDSIVYSLLAVRALAPEHFTRELFFLFGSQDDWNLFTPIFAWLISVVGLEPANRIVVLLGGSLWCLSFAVLGRAFFGLSVPMFFVTLTGAVISSSYSPNGATFVLNETFATARVVAMPLALIGIAADLHGRRWLGSSLCLLSTALHPLLGVWGLLVVACRRWPQCLLVASVAVVYVTVFVGGRFLPIGALQPMAGDWLDVVKHSSLDVFAIPTMNPDFGRPLFWLSVLWLGTRLGQQRFRDLYAIIVLMTATAYLLSLLCSSYYPVALVMQAQPWRVLWLAICFGVLSMTDVAWQLVRSGRVGVQLFGFALVSTYAFSAYAAVVVIGLCLLLDSPLLATCKRAVFDVLAKHSSHGWGALAISVLMLLPSITMDIRMSWVAVLGQERFPDNDFLFGFFIAGGCGLGLFLYSVVALAPWLRRLAILFLIPAISFAWSGWNHRSGKPVEMLNALSSQGGAFPPGMANELAGKVIAWPGYEQEVWFALSASNYVSGVQAIGVVFSEQKTREAMRRAQRMAAASMMDNEALALRPEIALSSYKQKSVASGLDLNNIRGYLRGEIGRGGLRYLCDDPELDWVVVKPRSPDSANDYLKREQFHYRSAEFSLYRCPDVRLERNQ